MGRVRNVGVNFLPMATHWVGDLNNNKIVTEMYTWRIGWGEAVLLVTSATQISIYLPWFSWVLLSPHRNIYHDGELGTGLAAQAVWAVSCTCSGYKSAFPPQLQGDTKMRRVRPFPAHIFLDDTSDKESLSKISSAWSPAEEWFSRPLSLRFWMWNALCILSS